MLRLHLYSKYNLQLRNAPYSRIFSSRLHFVCIWTRQHIKFVASDKKRLDSHLQNSFLVSAFTISCCTNRKEYIHANALMLWCFGLKKRESANSQQPEVRIIIINTTCQRCTHQWLWMSGVIAIAVLELLLSYGPTINIYVTAIIWPWFCS